MPHFKDPSRKIFEAHLGKEIRADHWEKIKSQMRLSGMPLIPGNLKLVAKCKRMAPRTPTSALVLNKVIQAYGELGEKAYGKEIKAVAFRLNENLSKDKFYRVFRLVGFPFTGETCFQTKDIGGILYRLLSDKNLGVVDQNGKKTSR